MASQPISSPRRLSSAMSCSSLCRLQSPAIACSVPAMRCGCSGGALTIAAVVIAVGFGGGDPFPANRDTSSEHVAFAAALPPCAIPPAATCREMGSATPVVENDPPHAIALSKTTIQDSRPMPNPIPMGSAPVRRDTASRRPRHRWWRRKPRSATQIARAVCGLRNRDARRGAARSRREVRAQPP